MKLYLSKPPIFLTLLMALLLAQSAAAKSSSRAQEIIHALGLKHLNAEAGLFKVVRVSDFQVTAPDGRSPVSNAIYFMLTPGEPQNYLHWLYSDDYQALIEGGPADYYLFFPDGKVAKYTMGRDVAAGQVLMVPSPAGTAKTIVLHHSADYLLVSSIVTPAWSPQRAHIGADENFIKKYAGKADWATPAFLQFLIGPNFGHHLGADGKGFEVSIDAQGQIIWQGMQLTEKQARLELQRLVSDRPGEAFTIHRLKDAPEAGVQKLKTLAKQVGVNQVRVVK